MFGHLLGDSIENPLLLNNQSNQIKSICNSQC